MKNKLLLCILVVVMIFGAAPKSIAQALPDLIGPQPMAPSIPPADPVVEVSMSAILTQAAQLKEEHHNIADAIENIANIDKQLVEGSSAEAKLASLRERLEESKKTGVYGFEQVADLRSQARGVLDSATGQLKKVAERLQKAEGLEQLWKSKNVLWAQHKNTYKTELNESLGGVILEAESFIADALIQLKDIELPLVNLQQRVLELQRNCQKFIGEIDKLMTEMRKDLFRQARPAMLTPVFFKQFDQKLWEEFWLGLASFELPAGSFYSSFGWVIALQIILTLMLIYFLRNLKNYNLDQLHIGFLAQRYIAASVLLGVLVSTMFYEDVPKMIKLIYAGLMAISAARLLAGHIETVWRRRLIYLLVALYLVIQLLGFIAFPAPAFRVFVATVGLAGALLCFWRARVNMQNPSSLSFVITVKIGGTAMLIVFLAQVAGYVALSNHILDVTIKTVFIGLLSWMFILILRGLTKALFDNKILRQSRIIDNHYQSFIKRSSSIMDALVVFFTFSGILATWGIADNTLQAAEKLWNLGLSLQGSRVTLGLLITAVIIAYLAFFSSWLIQRILDEEVYPRKKVERGVGISINRLIQYAFVIVGISLALSTLGVGMQNLTVIIGAFGIGIGFGLQNIVNNFASGLILLFERSIKVGDIVQIKGEWGVIKNLGLRATVVQTFDNSEIIVPNSDLVSIMVTNWTLSDRRVRLVMTIGVAYGSDIDLVTKLLFQVAQEHTSVMKTPGPAVLFLNFGSSSLDFELRVWVADIDNRLTIKNELNRHIDKLFSENGVEIPFPQYDLHLRTIDKPAKEALQSLAVQLPEQNP